MKNSNVWLVTEVIAAIVAGQGFYWFIGGNSGSANQARVVAVIGQIIVAGGVAIVADVRRRRSRRSGA